MLHRKRILIPVDVEDVSVQGLRLVRNMATETPLEVTLLYVLNLHIFPLEGRIYEEAHGQADQALRRLRDLFVDNDSPARVCVRRGCPFREIVTEANENEVELIVITGPRPRGWSRVCRSRTCESVVREAPCPTLVVPVDQNPGALSPPVLKPRAALF